MAYENKENTGVFFKEKEKKSEKAPDYRGTINVEGREFNLAGWLRESKKGTKFLSLKVESQDGRQGGYSRKEENNEAF